MRYKTPLRRSLGIDIRLGWEFDSVLCTRPSLHVVIGNIPPPKSLFTLALGKVRRSR